MDSYCLVRFRAAALAVVLAVALVPVAGAAIDVELRPPMQTVVVGDTVEIGLYVVSDDETDQLLAAVQIIIDWEPEFLQLLGHHSVGAVDLIGSGFPADPFNLNESDPPQDGDGMYVAFAPLGMPVAATPDGSLLTTFVFVALVPAPVTPVAILETAGDPPGETIVFDGTERNLDVTGTLTGALVEIEPCCPADLDFDCEVGVTDLLILLGAWGTDPGGPPDLDGNGDVGVTDLLELLGAWGLCP